jgi:hypothetical protein
VQALLSHLHAVGFDGAPRPLGIDERGREVLSFIPGTVPWPDRFDLLEPRKRLVRVAPRVHLGHGAPLKTSISHNQQGGANTREHTPRISHGYARDGNRYPCFTIALGIRREDGYRRAAALALILRCAHWGRHR